MKLLLVALTLLSSSLSLANGKGSAYSLFGIGDIRFFPGTRNAGMGFTGTAVIGGDHINSTSPATWSRLKQTRIEANFLYEGISANDGLRSLYRAAGLFNGVMIGIPIETSKGIAFVGGFTPFSNVSYRTVERGSQGNMSYTITHLGSGGIGKGQVGLSYTPIDDLSVGASLNYLFGTNTDTRTLLPDSSHLYSGGSSNHDLALRGVNVTLSGIYSGFGKLSESLKPLSAGFVVTTRANLTAERQTQYLFAGETDTSSLIGGGMSIPMAYGFGLAYQAGSRMILAADYHGQTWSKAELFGNAMKNIQNSYRFGIGAERMPNRDQSASWGDRLALRLGFTFGTSYYNVNGTSIDEWSATGGLTTPLMGETRLNVAIEYGRRGTLINNLIRDNILRVSMSLSIAEPWFIRFEEE